MPLRGQIRILALPEERSMATHEVVESPADEVEVPAPVQPTHHGDIDPTETGEWLESLQYVLRTKGPERVTYLLSVLDQAAHKEGVELPYAATTPYINTIPADEQPAYPGNREI